LTSAGGTVSEEAIALEAGIVMEIVAKIGVGSFANGLEERNPIVARATGVTLGACILNLPLCKQLSFDLLASFSFGKNK
jgi:hypothetical protein